MSIPDTVFNILRVAAPTLAAALGGPLAGAAATVATKALGNWLGMDGAAAVAPVSPAEIIDTVIRNADKPEFLLALRQAEIDLQKFEKELPFRFADLEVRDRDRAGQMQVQSGISDKVFTLGQRMMLADYVLGFTIIGGVVTAFFVSIPIDNREILNAGFALLGTILGRLTARADGVGNFYFGSSRSSETKTEQFSGVMRDMGAALQTVPERAPREPQQPAVVIHQGGQGPSETQESSMPSRFLDLVEGLLDREGGYVDHPRDPGGCTNMGITIGTLGNWRGAKVTCEDVKALTREEAKEIYYSQYWNAVRGDSLPSGLDVLVFDFAVNAGPGRAGRILQTLLRKRDPTIVVDGVIGKMTLAALKKSSPRALVDEFHDEKMAFYRSLETWPTFGKGWTSRADAVLAEARAVV